MTRTHNSTDRANLRNTLLQNGYNPLPLVDKGIRIKGWTTAEITTEWLDQFKRSGKFLNTGIRCDNLLAFDIDVLDEPLADQVEDLIFNTFGEPFPPCRVGRWPKRLLLYRLEGDPPEHSCRTGKYDGHQVELLCTRGRQFAAFGIHPGTGELYTWEDDISPENTPWSDLPAASAERALDVMNQIEDFFVAQGLTQERSGGLSGRFGTELYDLTDDFELLFPWGSTTYGTVKDTSNPDGEFCNIRRENGEFGDSNAVHAIRSPNGDLILHDFTRDTTHYPPTITPDLADTLPEPPTQPEKDMFLPESVADLMQHWVLIGDETVRPIDQPEYIFKLSGFKRAREHLTVPNPSPARGRAKEITAVDAWLRDPNTLRADAAALRLDQPDALFIQDGKVRVFNTYCPPDHRLIAEEGELDTVMEFIEHLVPRGTDRALFLDWHALKAAHPAWRMHGLVMVTQSYGTGRGTWTQILRRLFGIPYVNQVELHDLVGLGGQAQFNEYLVDSLIVSVPEALEERSEDATTWHARHRAYEQLKLVCDPIADRVAVKRKYGRNSTEWVYASVQISSNHTDALVIPQDDRRLIVLDNGEIPLTQAADDLYNRIHRWKEDPANIAALHRYLLQRAETATYDPFGDPPNTTAKQRMIDRGQSDLELLWDEYAHGGVTEGDICVFSQWHAFVQRVRHQRDVSLPTNKGKFEAGLRSVMSQHCKRPEEIPDQIRVAGQVVRPWIIRNFDKWLHCDDNAAIREEVLKNEPAKDETVVSFPKPERETRG